MNWFGRLDVIVLAFMLAHVVVVVARVSYRYHLARRAEAIDKASRKFYRDRRKLVADLSLKAGGLKSIAATAPFLGLAGTCIAILSAFRGIGMEKHAAMAMMASEISAALGTTAAGLLVAVPARWSCNYLQTRIDMLDIEIASNPLARHFPLTARFSKLPFAVIAAPGLAILVAVFTIFSSSYTPRGLSVRLLPKGALDIGHFSVKPVVIGIIGKSSSGIPAIYVNSTKTPSDELENTLRNKLRIRPEEVAYVQVEDNVSWRDVMNVIDVVNGLQPKVVLLTARPSSPHSRRSPGQTPGLKPRNLQVVTRP